MRDRVVTKLQQVSDLRMLTLLHLLEAGVLEDGVVSPARPTSTCKCWTRCGRTTAAISASWCVPGSRTVPCVHGTSKVRPASWPSGKAINRIRERVRKLVTSRNPRRLFHKAAPPATANAPRVARGSPWQSVRVRKARLLLRRMADRFVAGIGGRSWKCKFVSRIAPLP